MGPLSGQVCTPEPVAHTAGRLRPFGRLRHLGERDARFFRLQR